MSTLDTPAVRAARFVYRLIQGRKLRLTAISVRQRLRGTSVVNPVGHRLTFDPSDLRGRKLFQSRGILDRDAVALWNKLADAFEPTLVLDVGANYGEVVLSRRYRSETALHVVEANPRVARYLKENVMRAFPSARVHVGAATDRSGTVRLHIRSTLGAPHSGMASVELKDHSSAWKEVRAFRLDDEIPKGDRLLFKLDVEGHELSVLRGMAGLLDVAWIGMCEVTHLTNEQLDQLHDDYQILRVNSTTLETTPSPKRRALGADEMKDVILLPKGATAPFP